MTSSSKSSFTVFSEVDESVAKPVLGSDGAARWQDFKQVSKLRTTSSVAPALPLKKLDRALGMTSLRDEQANEAKIRKEAGDREAGSGYTDFKRNSDHEEAAERKRRKLITERMRPDDMSYFLQAETFEGYKFDYVFTTRDTRGTGYYWDGMDSLKKELGQPPTHSTNNEGGENGDDTAGTTKKSKTKKKKKKKVREPIFAPESDEFNPMEQVAQAILRRNQAMGAPHASLQTVDHTRADAAALGVDSSILNSAQSTASSQTLEPELVAAGWESAKDPNSGKTYYFKRSTNERSWGKPIVPKSAVGENNDGQLPDGWKSTKDQNSGKVYYYHTSGKTSWQKPTS